jgi:tungstate transport system ATP-binding protein
VEVDHSSYRLQDLRKQYAGRDVLNVAELEIQRGETLAIVGPNGAGKSTLLRILSFLEPGSAGEIWFEGQRMLYPAPLDLRRRIALVFQRPIMLRRSVRGNVAYGLRLRGEKDDGAVEQVLRDLDLEYCAHESALNLSGGEMQRVALARALVLEPEVLLLDEPTANLDPRNVALLEGMIETIRETGKTTVVLVTHNVHQAKRRADRVAMLLGGKLIEVAQTSDFFKSPKDPRAAAFVRGEMVC